MNNKNILESAQILVTVGRFIIFDIEGQSKKIAHMYYGVCSLDALTKKFSPCFVFRLAQIVVCQRPSFTPHAASSLLASAVFFML